MTGSQSEESMDDTLQKASLISKQKRVRSRINSSPILSHRAQNLVSVPWAPLCPLRQHCQKQLRADGWNWGCEPGVGYAPLMCFFGPGYMVKLAW